VRIYNEGQLNVSEGVSLTSTSQDNTKVVIQPKLDIYTMFDLVSSQNTDGNQTISHISISGEYGSNTAQRGIRVKNRNNVRITYCNIEGTPFFGLVAFSNFRDGAYQVIDFPSSSLDYWPDGDPTDIKIKEKWMLNPITNFEFSHSVVTNCGYWNGAPDTYPLAPSTRIFHVKDSTYHHNTITSDQHSFCLTSCSGFWENVEVYDNHFNGNPMGWRSDYPIEVWYTLNCKFYRNTANGSFSIAVGKYTKVYDNTIDSLSTRGLGIEFTGQSVGEVYQNNIKGSGYGIVVGASYGHTPHYYFVDDVEVHNNIIQDVNGNSIRIAGDGNSGFWGRSSNIKVYNNTLDGNINSVFPMIHIYQDDNVNMYDIKVKNNIVVNGKGTAGWTEKNNSEAVIETDIQNNLFYNNAYNFWSDDNPINTIIADPLFVGGNDYHLQSSSPAIDEGVDVGLPYIGSAPDIGAYEYGFLRGDLDGDGCVDITDLAMFVELWLQCNDPQNPDCEFLF